MPQICGFVPQRPSYKSWIPCGIFVGVNDTQAGSSLSISVFPVNLTPLVIILISHTQMYTRLIKTHNTMSLSHTILTTGLKYINFSGIPDHIQPFHTHHLTSKPIFTLVSVLCSYFGQ